MTEEKKSTYRGYTPAHNKAHQKYKQKNLVVMAIDMRPAERDRYKAAAAKSGLSLARFVKQAMDEKIERDLLD